MPRFIDIDQTLSSAAGADARSAMGITAAALNADFYVNAKDYGATGDGTTDDTEALQEWLDYVVENQRQGWLPTGTYKLTDTLIAAGDHYGWGIHGENENFSILSQFTDNIPVIQVGTTAGSSHTVQLNRLKFTYNSAQPSSNTNANCIVFEGSTTGDKSSLYWSSFRHLRFTNGYYAMTVASGRFAPWGCEWDMLTMNDMSGGMYDNTNSTVSGCPNNKWGRATILCTGAAGPIFKNIRGYNTVFGTLEFLVADQGPQLMTTTSLFTADIGSVKLEIGSYTGAGKSLFEFSNPCHVRIGSVAVGGTTAVFTPTSGILAIIGSSGAVTIDKQSDIEIGSIEAYASSLSGTAVAVNGGGCRYTIRNVYFEDGWTLQSTGSSGTGNLVTVSRWVNGALSTNKGDADYTVALGDPNVAVFNTAFTAPRTITLPSKGSNDRCAGLYYDLIFSGAINGANTAVIKEGSNTLRTQSTDGVRLRYMWARQTAVGQWVLVDVVDLTA